MGISRGLADMDGAGGTLASCVWLVDRMPNGHGIRKSMEMVVGLSVTMTDDLTFGMDLALRMVGEMAVGAVV